MKAEVRALLDRVRDTADYGYVEFSDINETNALGANALHCVIIWGDIDAARLLIDNGIDIDQPGEFLFTPLHVACDFGHEDIVRLLLERGANPFARTEGDLPSTIARESGHDAICDLLDPLMSAGDPNRSRRSDAHRDQLQRGIDVLEQQVREMCGTPPKTP